MVDLDYLCHLINDSLHIHREICQWNGVLVEHTDILFPSILNMLENKRVNLTDCKTGSKLKSYLEAVALNKRVLKYRDSFDGYNYLIAKLPLQELLGSSLVKSNPYVEYSGKCEGDSCTNCLTLLKTDQMSVMVEGEGIVEWDIWEHSTLKPALMEITSKDPFIESSLYLDEYWKSRLPPAKRIEQRVGDIMYLPAGTVYQTVNKCLANQVI
ncbi:hypothetical protein HDV01_002877 [Terramyces sp. JEL0728]|nr:hypothetical protein HDV01_002877 [Terramyces sp. JEL0728]